MSYPGRWWHNPDPQDAFWLSWIGMVCSIIAAIGGIVGFKKTGSSLILAFGLENLVDFTSSAIVLWRFYCPLGCDGARVAKLNKREERASLAITIVILIMGVFILCVAIYDVSVQEKEQNLHLLFIISLVSVVVFGTLTIIKFKFAMVLDSLSLYKDGICSVIGTCLSASLLVTSSIIDEVPQAGYIDPVISLIVGLAAIIYGSKVIITLMVNGVPIFRINWWISQNEMIEETTDAEDKFSVGMQKLSHTENIAINETDDKCTTSTSVGRNIV